MDAEVERWDARRATRRAEQQARSPSVEGGPDGPTALALLEVTLPRRWSGPTLSRGRVVGGAGARGVRRAATGVRCTTGCSPAATSSRPTISRPRRGGLVARRDARVDGRRRGRLPASRRRRRTPSTPPTCALRLALAWGTRGDIQVAAGLDDPGRPAARRAPPRPRARQAALSPRRLQHGRRGRRRARRGGGRGDLASARRARRPDPRLLRPGAGGHGAVRRGETAARLRRVSTRRCCPCSRGASTRSGPATSTAPPSTCARAWPTSPGCATGPRPWPAGPPAVAETFMYAGVTRVHELQMVSAEGGWDVVEEELGRREREPRRRARLAVGHGLLRAGRGTPAPRRSGRCAGGVRPSAVVRRRSAAGRGAAAQRGEGGPRRRWPSCASRWPSRAASSGREAAAPAVELALRARRHGLRRQRWPTELEATAAFYGTPGPARARRPGAGTARTRRTAARPTPSPPLERAAAVYRAQRYRHAGADRARAAGRRTPRARLHDDGRRRARRRPWRSTSGSAPTPTSTAWPRAPCPAG